MWLPRAHLAIVAAALVSTASLAVGAAAFVTSIKLTDTGNERVVQPGLLPPSPSGTDPLTDFGIGFYDVHFPAADGSSMSGWLVPGSHPDYGIVTVHGRGADRRDFLTRLPVL